MKTAAAYTRAQKALHWAVAALMLLQFTLLEEMGRPFHRLMDTGMAEYSLVAIGHIGAGVLILAFAAWRLALRRTHGAMEPPEEEPEIARKAAHWGHAALYALMIFMPLGGLLAWFGRFGPAAALHEIASNILLLLIAGHVAAVLLHQLHWKTNLIARMK